MRRRRRRLTLASLFALGAAVAVVGLLFSGVTQAAPPDPNTVGSDTVSNVVINGVPGTTLTVAPGADVSISADWSDAGSSSCPTCIDYLAVGFAGQAAAPGALKTTLLSTARRRADLAARTWEMRPPPPARTTSLPHTNRCTTAASTGMTERAVL
jgi:hypothetical protein